MKNLFDIKGKTALVTGGSRGIGEMIAAGFLANGAKVYISSRKADACADAVERLKEFGGECIAIPANLADKAGADALVEELAKREDHLDILVNNAGASWGAPLGEFPGSGFDKVPALSGPCDLVPAHALETHPDVGLDVADEVPEVDVVVHIGQGVGDEDAAGHEMSARIEELAAACRADGGTGERATP